MLQKELIPFTSPKRPIDLTKTILPKERKFHKPKFSKRQTFNITTNNPNKNNNTSNHSYINNNADINNNRDIAIAFAIDSGGKDHKVKKPTKPKASPNIFFYGNQSPTNKSLQSLISNNINMLYKNLFLNKNYAYAIDKQQFYERKGKDGNMKYNVAANNNSNSNSINSSSNNDNMLIGLLNNNFNPFKSTQLKHTIPHGNFLKIEGTGISNKDLQYHMVENNHLLSDRTHYKRELNDFNNYNNVIRHEKTLPSKQKILYSHYKNAIPTPRNHEEKDIFPISSKQSNLIEISNSTHNVILPKIKEDSLSKHKPTLSPSSSTNKTINYNHSYQKDDIVKYPKDDLNYYDTSKYYYYIIYPENCGYLIKRCMENRSNWKESQNMTTNLFHFKWRDCASKINFNQLSTPTSSVAISMSTTANTPTHNIIMNQCVNHFEHHSSISNKANMFINLMNYCEENNKEVLQYVPFTIVLEYPNQKFYDLLNSFKKVFENITSYLYDYEQIKQKVYSRKNVTYMSMFPLKETKLGLRTNIMIPDSHYNNKNLWIFKASHLNRGRGIQLIDSFEAGSKYVKQSISGNLHDYSEEIGNEGNNNNKEDPSPNQSPIKGESSCLSQTQTQGQVQGQPGNQAQIQTKPTYHSNKIIIQKYIEKPLLYNNRKFDIRIWVLITHKFEVYIFKEGHLKTCSIDYNCNDINSYIHITNYSLQKYNKYFSKYEKGNEVSFDQFQNYLNLQYSDKHLNVREDFISKFKEIIEMTCKSVRCKLNKNNRTSCFEIYGYDFIMDELFNIYLIEVNTNPGLEESSDLIKALIPRMLDDALRLTIDVLYDVKYKEECIDNNGAYKSLYHIDNYNDSENLWEFVCDLNKKKDKESQFKQIFKFNKRKENEES